MAPIKSSLAKTAKQLLGFRNTADLGLRGATQSSRVPPPADIPFRFAMFGGGGSGAGWVGAGGGGGGYVEEEITALVTGVDYTVTIGAAGATPGSAPPGPNADGNAGGNTTFATPGGTFTAYGGGGGGGNNLAGQPGGAGGGAGGTSNATVGSGNKVTGTSNPAQASPPQPQTLSRVQGYDGGTYGDQPGGENSGGGGGAGGAGSDGSNSGGGGAGGAGITVSNYGPYNGTFGAGGGGSSASGAGGSGGSPFAGSGVNSTDSSNDATGYANGGGGVREAGYAGGSATAGIFLMRTPDAVTITLSSGTQTSGSGYKYVRMTGNGTISFS